MFTFQKCILLCKMKWTLLSRLKLREYSTFYFFGVNDPETEGGTVAESDVSSL